VDRDDGPALFERGQVDEIGETVGGVALPFTLPVILSTANYESVAIAGRVKTRRLRWGGFVREVRNGSARLTVRNDDAGTLTLRVLTPDATTWEGNRDFDASGKSDINRTKQCGKPGLEAEIEIVTTAGRPTINALQVETTAAGRVQED
jgi:hypothetical protein